MCFSVYSDRSHSPSIHKLCSFISSDEFDEFGALRPEPKLLSSMVWSLQAILLELVALGSPKNEGLCRRAGHFLQPFFPPYKWYKEALGS